MATFEKARKEDAKALALASWQAFDHDINYGAQGKGGPPGYKSEAWQRKMMRYGEYYKIVEGGQIIGGLIVFNQGGGHYELGRIFFVPEYQNRGIGAQAITFIERTFPAHRWTLDTPSWNIRNQYFYEKMGYSKVREERINDGFSLVFYEKHTGGKRP